MHLHHHTLLLHQLAGCCKVTHHCCLTTRRRLCPCRRAGVGRRGARSAWPWLLLVMVTATEEGMRQEAWEALLRLAEPPQGGQPMRHAVPAVAIPAAVCCTVHYFLRHHSLTNRAGTHIPCGHARLDGIHCSCQLSPLAQPQGGLKRGGDHSVHAVLGSPGGQLQRALQPPRHCGLQDQRHHPSLPPVRGLRGVGAHSTCRPWIQRDLSP